MQCGLRRIGDAAVFHGHADHATYQGRITKDMPGYICCLQLVRNLKPKDRHELVEVWCPTSFTAVSLFLSIRVSPLPS